MQFYDRGQSEISDEGGRSERGGLFQLHGVEADGGVCEPVFPESELDLYCRARGDAVVDRAGRAEEVRYGDRRG